MPLPPNDPYIEAIAERVRGVVSRQLGVEVNAVAATLDVSEASFRHLIEDRDRPIDVAFLMDVLAAMVRVLGLDPKWLLTGDYDSRTHRRALELIEANSHVAQRTVREWLRERYQRLRAGLDPWSSMAR